MAASHSQDDEARLIAEAKHRSPAAWTAIYDAYYRPVYRYCYARIGDPETAADLASDVFLRAMEGIGRYVYQGRPLLAWLYRIAHHVVSDYFRRHDRARRALWREAASLATHDPGPAAQVEAQRDVWCALQGLTEEQQQVVALRYFVGLSTTEIAQVMGRSERAIYSLEARALAGLRRLFQRDTVRPAA
jgi:RNA polymerase sigma-70 factor (ECF subfamily)